MQTAYEKELKRRAIDIRQNTIAMIANLGVGHIGGALSIADALAVLYFKEMNIDPANPHKADRDRFVLSKGHAGPSLYAALALKGYFDVAELNTLNCPGTHLPSHCDMLRTKGIDMTAGSLGQGFPCAVGMALAAKLDHSTSRIYAIVGDGECQEGSVWEAAMLGGSRCLDNLVCMVDNNKLQIDGFVKDINTIDPLADKWTAFGWNVIDIDGHDIAAIVNSLDAARAEKGRPTCIILNTVKAKGFKPVEGRPESHNTSVSQADARESIEILAREAKTL